jgi:hypothetical protein
MQKDRRRSRWVRLLLIAALVAVKLAVPGASKAAPLTWAPAAQAADVTNNVASQTAGQGLPKSNAALGGFTEQGWPVVLEVNHGGNRVAVAATGLDLTCSSGDQFSVEDAFARVRVASNGTVRASEQFAPRSGTSVSLMGGSHSLTGRLDRQHSTFRGVWREHLMLKLADGTTDDCHSGPVSLIATR